MNEDDPVYMALQHAQDAERSLGRAIGLLTTALVEGDDRQAYITDRGNYTVSISSLQNAFNQEWFMIRRYRQDLERISTKARVRS